MHILQVGIAEVPHIDFEIIFYMINQNQINCGFVQKQIVDTLLTVL